MHPRSRRRCTSSRRRSTRRSRASSSRRGASRSTSSRRNRRTTSPPGTKAPDPASCRLRVKAIILAAGYATRLSPLRDPGAKPLLPVGGRPMVEEICDRIDAVPEVDELHVVTNSRFAQAFAEWADARDGRLVPVVHDDGTSSNEDRLGAIGDIRFTVEEAGLEGEDLLVVAGDNLFEFALEGLVQFWQQVAQPASAVAVYQCGSLELASKYGVVELDDAKRIVSFEEKPAAPRSDLVATATYL